MWCGCFVLVLVILDNGGSGWYRRVVPRRRWLRLWGDPVTRAWNGYFDRLNLSLASMGLFGPGSGGEDPRFWASVATVTPVTVTAEEAFMAVVGGLSVRTSASAAHLEHSQTDLQLLASS